MRIGIDAERERDLDEPVRVAARRRAHDEHGRAAPRQLLHRVLAILRRVADVVLRGLVDRREAPPQHLDDLAHVVDRQRRLRDVRDVLGFGTSSPLGLFGVSTTTIASGASPSVPITSTCCDGPTRMIV
jgi:hypothetical protein